MKNAPIAPKDYYQYTKWEGEKVVQEFIKKGLPAVILRPTAIYGPGDPERLELSIDGSKSGLISHVRIGANHLSPLVY